MFGQQIGRHGWFTSLTLLLGILLVACAGQSIQVESASTIGSGVSSTRLPTGTPEPTLRVEPSKKPTAAPTALPTETQEPTSTPKPTETPTPEPTATLAGPETYGIVFPEVSTEQIERALTNLKWENTWPLVRFNSGWMIIGVLANHRFTDVYLDPDRKEHVMLMTTFYYKDPDEILREFDVSLYSENLESGLSRGLAEAFTLSPKMISGLLSYIEVVHGGLATQNGAILENANMQISVPGPSGREPVYVPEYDTYVTDAEDYIQPFIEPLGMTREILAQFATDGDPSHLPLVDGRPFMLHIRVTLH